MNPGPGTSWPDLQYEEAEQVQLDVAAIIARGTRLRRKRLISKATVIAIITAIAPTAVAMDMLAPAPETSLAGPSRANPPSNGRGVVNGPILGPNHRAMGMVGIPAPTPASPVKFAAHSMAGIFSSDLNNGPAQAVVYRTTSLSARYGAMLAIAGARGGSGVWFAATASQLTLFRLSVTGAMKSWPLPTATRNTRADANIGLAVTAGGVAWLGVESTLYRLDTKTAQLRSWPVPVTALAPTAEATATRDVRLGAGTQVGPSLRPGDSVAVSPDGHVAVMLPHSAGVQVLDPRDGTFRPVRLPAANDLPLAVGYARNGTLGIGFQRLGRRPSAGLLLVSRSGTESTTRVAQATSVTAYGAFGLLVGITRPEVVSAQGAVRPLRLPANTDFADVRTPPESLPGNRLGIALDTAVLTFPATADSIAVASAQSQLWVVPPTRCRPHRDCPAGFGLMTTDAAGDMWVVPAADQRMIELVSLG